MNIAKKLLPLTLAFVILISCVFCCGNVFSVTALAEGTETEETAPSETPDSDDVPDTDTESGDSLLNTLAEKVLEAVSAAPGTKVWFYNSDGWAAVSAYVYNSNPNDALGAWPGTAATRDGSTNWWSIEVPAEPSFTIIFNNNDKGKQSADINIDDTTKLYIMKNTAYASKKDAEAAGSGSSETQPVNSTKVYFYNSDGWAAVSAYVYNSNPNDALGAWPGTAATRDGNTDWWSIEVPASPEFTIIFNNNDSENNKQTESVNIKDKTNVYLSMKDNGTAHASRKDAEDAVDDTPEPQDDSTTVWFYNSDGWASVSAYVYNSDPAEVLGGWPGTAATRDGSTNWWSVEVPVAPGFTIIFNNNDSENNKQTESININDKTNVYISLKDNGAAFDSKDDAEVSVAPAASGTKVWFYNSDSWASVYAYVYNQNGPSEVFGGWPGVAATRDGNTDWWSVEVPVAPGFTIIFNNNDSENNKQTESVNIKDTTKVFISLKDNGTAFTSKAEAEAAVTPSTPDTKVWFFNSNGWSSVYAYVYNSQGGPSEIFGGWPGTEATQDGYSNWWYVNVPAQPEFTIIFNNNSGNQTEDVAIKDAANVFVTVSSKTPYPSKADAEESIADSTEPQPIAEDTTVWFYNSAGWSNVYAYVYGSNPTEALGAWPGTVAKRDGNTKWWSVDVPSAPGFTVIFNNNNGSQSKDVAISDTENIYVNISSTTAYASRADAEAEASASTEPKPAGSTTVWFYNSGNWSNVYAYVYNSNPAEALGAWPGRRATRDGSSKWWSVKVPSEPGFSIIFNNNSGNQSKDVMIPDAKHVYVNVSSATAYPSKTEAANAQKKAGTTRVWYYNSGNWSRVYAYVYGADSVDPLGAWPGKKATRDGSTKWWYIDVPSSPGFTVIFNNNSGNQSKDVAIPDAKHVYVNVSSTTAYTSRALAVTAQKAAGTTRVWYYNSGNWSKVYAYVYGADSVDPLGAWPGKKATRDGSTKWWYIDVPSSPGFTVIFNNNEGKQSKDVAIPDTKHIYVTLSNDTAYTSRVTAASAQQVAGITRVWFYNVDDWYDVHAYVYGADSDDPLGAWPGRSIKQDGSSSWWYVDVPSAPEFVIIFNNGDTAQASDVTIMDHKNVYVNRSGPSAYASKKDAEADQAIYDLDRKGTKRIWFYNSEGWVNIYAYVYGSAQSDPLGAWPGSNCSQYDTRWWYIDVNVDCPYSIIFNNGRDSQSPDTNITNGSEVYVTMNSGSPYASQGAAEASIDYLKPLIEPTTTVWFYNNVGWTNVYAYAWGTEDENPLGEWHGTQAKRYEKTNWWYVYCDFAAPFYIIFNDGDSAQTKGVHIEDSTTIYTTFNDEKYATKEEAEKAADKALNSARTRVYFYNSEGWSEVYAYSWGAVRSNPLGMWPGKKATRESENSYWYYIDCPVDPPFFIIFNNGSDEQTEGVQIEDTEYVYLTVNDEKFNSKSAAEATISEVKPILPVRADTAQTIWFYNTDSPDKWDRVYLYMQNSEKEDFYGPKPGIEMYREGSSDWYYMNVAATPAFTVSFSDGEGKDSSVYTVADKERVYFTASGQFASKPEAEGIEVAEAVTKPSEEDTNHPGIGTLLALGGAAFVVIVGGYALFLQAATKKKKPTAQK